MKADISAVASDPDKQSGPRHHPLSPSGTGSTHGSVSKTYLQGRLLTDGGDDATDP
jgi:hypothetical protein